MINVEASASKIVGYMKKSSQWVIDVGKELSRVKSLASEKDYLAMYDLLPFGEKVGEKFIAIAGDKFIEKYIDIVPASYNTLYDTLLASKIKKLSGIDAEIVWEEIGNEMMFGGPDYDFSISGMALSPVSTKQEILDVFKMLKMASKKPDPVNGGLAGATGELTDFLKKEKAQVEKDKAIEESKAVSRQKRETLKEDQKAEAKAKKTEAVSSTVDAKPSTSASSQEVSKKKRIPVLSAYTTKEGNKDATKSVFSMRLPAVSNKDFNCSLKPVDAEVLSQCISELEDVIKKYPSLSPIVDSITIVDGEEVARMGDVVYPFNPTVVFEKNTKAGKVKASKPSNTNKKETAMAA